MDTPDAPRPRGANTALVLAGAVILIIGLAVLADRHLDRGAPLIPSLWPLVLIVMGAARSMTGSSHRTTGPGRRGAAAWLVMVGIWGLVSEGRLFGLTYATSWPLLIVAAGLVMVLRSLDVDAARSPRREQ